MEHGLPRDRGCSSLGEQGGGQTLLSVLPREPGQRRALCDAMQGNAVVLFLTVGITFAELRAGKHP